MEIRTISQLIEKLVKIKEKHGDLKLIYSIDDEGNAYKPVYYEPTVCKHDGHDIDTSKEAQENPTHVCIN